MVVDIEGTRFHVHPVQEVVDGGEIVVLLGGGVVDVDICTAWWLQKCLGGYLILADSIYQKTAYYVGYGFRLGQIVVGILAHLG